MGIIASTRRAGSPRSRSCSRPSSAASVLPDDEVASVNLRPERHHLARQEEIMKTLWMGLVAGFVLGQARTADFGEDPTFRYELEGKNRKRKWVA